MTDPHDDPMLFQAAQAMYPLLYEDAPYPAPNGPIEKYGPFAEVVGELRSLHEAANRAAESGELFDVWTVCRDCWEGMRTNDDGSKRYGLLDRTIRKIADSLDEVQAQASRNEIRGAMRVVEPGAAPLVRTVTPILDVHKHTTGTALMAKDIPPPRQFVKGLIREGLSFFIGQPGVGKTPALIQLVIALATGGMWLGVFRVPKLKVVYIGPEYDEGDVRSIILASTGGRVALDNLLIFTVENFIAPNSEEEAIQFIDDLVRVYGIEAIVVDLFPGFLPPEKFKQNAYRGDYREFLAYHRVALKHHIMFMGAWHGTKRDANPATMYNGGQGFWGAAGGGRLVMFQDDEDTVKLYSQLRGNKAVTYSLVESHEGGVHAWAALEGLEPEPMFGSDIHRTIYRIIKDHAPAHGLTPKTIAGLVRPETDAKIGDAYLRKCLGVLTRRGILRQIGDGYVVTRGSGGSQGSEVYEDQEDRGDQEVCSDPSDPSPIPSRDRPFLASERIESRPDPSDPLLLAIPADPDDVFFPVPPARRTNLRLYLRGNKESDQDRARELCEEYGVDYERARKAVT
jgi:hypothetical protein